MLALSAPTTANPLPIQPTGTMCSPMMDPPPEICAHLTDTPTTGASTTNQPGEDDLCPLHTTDKARLFNPDPDSASEDDLLLIGGLTNNLRTIRMVMCELHEEYVSTFVLNEEPSLHRKKKSLKKHRQFTLHKVKVA